jgi:sugar lactone lactonase YvrE
MHAQVITTVAGIGVNGYTGDGGPALDAAIMPAGLTTDSAGNIYFGDIVHNVVRKIDASGIITTIAGSGIDAPGDVAVDKNGNVYVTELISNRVKKISPSGVITTIAGGGGARDFTHDAVATHVSLWAPDGIAVDSEGTIYFAERFNHCISKVTKDGMISTIAGTGTGGYNGEDIPATDAQLNGPMGIAVDAAGNIYVAEQGNERVRKISLSGNITTVAGCGTSGYNGDNILATTALLNYTRDVAVDKDGNVYIADLSNQRIRRVNGTGIITTVAGTGIVGYSGDGGPAVDAQLKSPGCITVNSFGNIYIADIGNGRIRRVRYSLSVKDAAETISAIDVYPNPSNGRFTLSVASIAVQHARITITNVLGEQVYEGVCSPGKDKEIDLSTAPGLYLLSVYTTGGRCTKRISIVK